MASALFARGQAALGRIPGPARIVAVSGLAIAIAVGTIAVVRIAMPRPAPLVDDTAQGGALTCVPSPNKPAGTLRWNTAIGFGESYFYNRSGHPLMLESVSLIDPHNVDLLGAEVYETAQDPKDLVNGGAFASEPVGVKLAASPGHDQQAATAVIRPVGVGKPRPGRRGHVYEVLLGVSARSPHGAWAAGFRLTYRAQGRTYTVSTYEGYAIAVNDPARSTCDGLFQGIENSWAAANLG